MPAPRRKSRPQPAILQLRRRLITQQQVANQAGMSLQSAGAMLRAQVHPSDRLVLTVEAMTGLPRTELFEADVLVDRRLRAPK